MPTNKTPQTKSAMKLREDATSPRARWREAARQDYEQKAPALAPLYDKLKEEIAAQGLTMQDFISHAEYRSME